MKKLILATRGSLLALKQTETIRKLLLKYGVETEVLETTTKGDRDRIHALVRMGGNGVFIREIEEKLKSREADIAVHSAKDLPYELADGLVIAGVPDMADPRDCLILKKGHTLSASSVIGTGSPRRISEFKKLYGEVVFKDIRGNITTRLKKLEEGIYDGIILAKAGLDRIGADLSAYDVNVLDTGDFLPAPCQGILAVECRQEDKEICKLLKKISKDDVFKRFNIERELFSLLKANCASPLGIFCKINGEHVELTAMLEGKRAVVEGSYKDHEAICRDIKSQLLRGRVVFVGAGCGHGLITVNGLNELRAADVVVYDDLMDHTLLNETKPDSKQIYVGKRSGAHSHSQEEINKLLIKYASLGENVVRLKGGDSYVFGRGGEEVMALDKAGIPHKIIPGVSSAIAAPEHMGIPVSHRGTSSLFTVVTGHRKDNMKEDWDILAKLSGTIVFLMGLSNLSYITASLIEHGKCEDVPVSVLSDVYGKNEKRIDGTLKNIYDAVKEANISSPAIIIVGDTAAFHLEDNDGKGILDGIKMQVVGSERFIRNVYKEVSQEGCLVYPIEVIRVVAMSDQIPKALEIYDWIVFTSRNGVNIFFDWMNKNRKDVRSLAATKFACVGPGTGEELLKHGIHADFIPSLYAADKLGEELSASIKKEEKVLILRAEEGSEELDRHLEKDGIAFKVCTIYRTEYKEADRIEQGCDYIVFGSGSGVRGYFQKMNEASTLSKPVCLGESTAVELKRQGIDDYLISNEQSIKGVIETIKKDISEKNGVK